MRTGFNEKLSSLARVGLLFVGLCWSSPAAAHDFWLQPNNFSLAPHASIAMSIQVGHGSFRQAWAVDTERVVMFESIGPDGVQDIRSSLKATRGFDVATLHFDGPATYLIAFQTNPAVSNLPFIRYNDYAKFEGLTLPLDYRAQTHATEQPGREIYSRRCKALVQVGLPAKGSPWVTKPLGLTLEIVPEKNPYLLAPNDLLPVRIYYEGKPLAGSLVMLTNLEFDGRPLESHLSDKDGRAAFQVPRTGTWLVNVVWSKPIKGDPRGDFDTTFSSLTFAYPPRGYAH